MPGKREGTRALLSLQTHPVRVCAQASVQRVCALRKVAAAKTAVLETVWKHSAGPGARALTPSSLLYHRMRVTCRAVQLTCLVIGDPVSQVPTRPPRSCEVLDSTLAPSPSVGATKPLPEGIQIQCI